MRRRDSSGHPGERWRTGACAAVALVALALVSTPAHAAGLLVADGGFGGVLEIQEHNVDSDWATYVYPLATATRNDVDSRTRGRFALTLDVRSEIPIERVTSPSHGDEFVTARHADS